MWGKFNKQSFKLEECYRASISRISDLKEYKIKVKQYHKLIV